jgi:hypothetical protein
MEFKQISEITGYEEFTNFVLNIAGEIQNVKTGKLLKWKKNKAGYLRVQLSQAPAKRMISQHRAICCLFKPNPRNLPQVDHINRNRSDNRIENLQWASRLENMQNVGTPITNTSGEKHILMIFKHGKPVWIIAMKFNGKRRCKRFPRDVTSNEIPQEVIDYRDAMRLEIETELQMLRE